MSCNTSSEQLNQINLGILCYLNAFAIYKTGWSLKRSFHSCQFVRKIISNLYNGMFERANTQDTGKSPRFVSTKKSVETGHQKSQHHILANTNAIS